MDSSGIKSAGRSSALKFAIYTIDRKPEFRAWLQRAMLDYFDELAKYDPDYYNLLSRLDQSPDLLVRLYNRRCLTTYVTAAGLQPAGFAVVAHAPDPRVSPEADYRMGEFYIGPGFRRQGLGRQAAKALFRLLPGRWEVTQIPVNDPAIKFWLRVIGEITGGEFQDALDGTNRRQIFKISAE
jgi:predicted acetyltransferase